MNIVKIRNELRNGRTIFDLPLRVTFYARVSTDRDEQLNSLENQVQYYDDILSRHADWTLVDRYIDEGITGTSIHKRESFMRMLKDAKEKKFDLIVTREVSRFARNTVDTLQQTRTLKTYGVEVWFTEDNIWTMNGDVEKVYVEGTHEKLVSPEDFDWGSGAKSKTSNRKT